MLSAYRKPTGGVFLEKLCKVLLTSNFDLGVIAKRSISLYGEIMKLLSLLFTRRLFALAAMLVVLVAFGGKAEAGCGEYVTIGGITFDLPMAGHNISGEPATPIVPKCHGPNCSSKPNPLPLIPPVNHTRLAPPIDEWVANAQAIAAQSSLSGISIAIVSAGTPIHCSSITYRPPRSI